MKATALLMLALTVGFPAHARAEDQTRAQMGEIFEAVQFLLPLSLDEKRFAAPADREHILRSLELLARSSADLEAHGAGHDVAFSYLSHALAADARDVHRRFREGHPSEARFLVQQLAETCVACHSRLPSERDAQLSARFADHDALAALPLQQRAKLEYATRQFDRAFDSYEALLASPEVSPTELDLMGYLDDYLELCIRVRGDLARPARALERFASRDDLTPTLRGEIDSWITSLRALARREPAPAGLEEARALLRHAQDPQRFRDERDALIDYLQASAVLHRYLADGPATRAALAESYYLLGLIETRVGKSFWLSQAEALLEASIRANPGSTTAQSAYELLDEFLVAGYTGSGGTHVPPDIQVRLDALRALAYEGPAG